MEQKAASENEVAVKAPPGMPFILCNILSERFCSAGISAILALYFNVKLNLDPNMATSVFHIHEFLAFSFSIIGAMIADSWWGHFKTLIWMELLYCLGSIVIAVGNIIPLGLSIEILTIIGLLPMVIGSGSIRVNLSVFGANQYKLPEQAAQFSVYFSLQYFVLKSGSVLGRLALPILRQDVKCFGMNDCYPLAFGVTAIVMLTGFTFLISGSKHHVKKPPSGNVLLQVCRCIMCGLSGKFKALFDKSTPKDHWLDYAEEEFGLKTVTDTKTVVNILILYIPLPIYWAVYVQQASRWVFQAARMDGNLRFISYTIKPDQMIIFNSVLGLLMIPVCEYVLYPLLALARLKTPLQKMTIGGIFASIAFVLSGFVEMEIKNNYISIIWLVPQYLVLALSENFLYIANIKFAYTEAPESMKSAMQAFTFLTNALGNAIVAIISGLKIFESQATELFFFAGVLFINQIIFGLLAVNYKYSKSDTFKKDSLINK